MKKAIWVCELLEDLCHKLDGPSVIYDDSKTCIVVMNNPMFHPCTKHIEIQHPIICDRVESRRLH